MEKISTSEAPMFYSWEPEDSVGLENEMQAAKLLQYLYPCHADNVHIARCMDVSDLADKGYFGDPIYVDAYLQDESIVVQIDTFEDYTQPGRIMETYRKEEQLTKLGYTFIRIPFWVQLTNETVQHFFGPWTSIPIQSESPVMSGFYECPDHYFCDEEMPNPYLPACYCSLGWNKFLRDYMSLPSQAFKQVKDSLDVQKKKFGQELVFVCFPEGLSCSNCPIGQEKREIEEAWNSSMCYCGTPQ